MKERYLDVWYRTSHERLDAVTANDEVKRRDLAVLKHTLNLVPVARTRQPLQLLVEAHAVRWEGPSEKALEMVAHDEVGKHRAVRG